MFVLQNKGEKIVVCHNRESTLSYNPVDVKLETRFFGKDIRYILCPVCYKRNYL